MVGGLNHRGNRRSEQIVHGELVEGGEGDIARGFQAAIAKRAQDAEGGGPLVQKTASGRVAGLLSRVRQIAFTSSGRKLPCQIKSSSTAMPAPISACLYP